ncbi:sigma-70 family RNA polymerase sigma factor [Streptomyces sp. NBC_01142]|uniref:sigma-70 family RNA polymerase sigma factor n=1 Tax=Streptomyces sp. NBC_01142 TaxID=2975865 RepID=UPI00225B0FA5|nr:sigma-70 family RNA polymerase sigma factor [Streptomyces sp. NBC_01142]MCX4820231.1 sigma-70 family RNA polymerase sigma factor [Streptomyces sp. NBC_01142]
MATDMHSAYSGGPADAAHERWQRAWSHREQLLKVARRRSMSVEDAEDAVHEAMLRAAENPHLDDERLGAWLTTVTMRLCIDRHRQVNREAEVHSSAGLVPPGPAPVEEAVCDRAEAKWLAVRTGELPARQAEALRLKSEDLDVGQVAHEMGLSYRTVESLLARARRSLRNSLAGTLGLAMWLCGRGQSRPGGNAQAVAMVSTAATLAVAGFVLPYAHDGDRPGSPRPAAPAVSEAADVRPPAPGRAQPPRVRTLGGTRASSAESATPSPGGHPLVPSLPEVPLPALAAPDVPPVPDVPEVSVPSAPPVPVTVPSIPVDVPDPQDTPVELPDNTLHTNVHP